MKQTTFTMATLMSMIALLLVTIAPVSAYQITGTSLRISNRVCLVNRTDRDVRYFYKWGDTDWQTAWLSFDHRRTHRYVRDRNVEAPTFVIRFDTDSGTARNVKEYVLKTYRSRECREYVFRSVSDRIFDLYRTQTHNRARER